MRHVNKSRHQCVSIVTVFIGHFNDSLLNIGPIDVATQPINSQTLCSSHCHLQILDFLFDRPGYSTVGFCFIYKVNKTRFNER